MQQDALREAEAADELRREAEQTAAAVRIQAVQRGRLIRRAGAARQYSVDSRWGQQFLKGLGPSGVRASRPARHNECSRDYLRRLMLPRLGDAMRAAEAARPEDPAAFIAAQLRESSWVLKEWEEIAPAAERSAAAERREADDKSSMEYIAELRQLTGVHEAMIKVSIERPERPWEVVADYILATRARLAGGSA